MYTVPVGQNPSGAVSISYVIFVSFNVLMRPQTMGEARKKEIYDICVEFGTIGILVPHHLDLHSLHLDRLDRRYHRRR